MKYNKCFFSLLLMIVLGSLVDAHLVDFQLDPGIEYEQMHIEGYDVVFIVPEEPLSVGEEISFAAVLIIMSETLALDADVQGQIIDTKTDKEIFYSNTTQVKSGYYAFTWTPTVAGDYQVQFVFRSIYGTILQPTFSFTVKEKDQGYIAWIVLVVAIFSIAIGIIKALPEKKRGKFGWLAFFSGILIAMVIFGGFAGYKIYKKSTTSLIECTSDYCNIPVHAHSNLTMTLCGEAFSLPNETGLLNEQHTHAEGRLHLHTMINVDKDTNTLQDKEKARLGVLFEKLGIPFNSTCLGNRCNGFYCGNEPGTLKMSVNGKPNNQFNNYVWNDGDQIVVSFASE